MPDERERLLRRAIARILARPRPPVRVGVKLPPVSREIAARLLPGRVTARLTENAAGEWTYEAAPPCDVPLCGDEDARGGPPPGPGAVRVS